ncbi:PIN-like domain-containing protein [Alkalimonas delamerensis]|uniref:PIN-like domain-containing protein n=1 Tax=Alkalimonas delamerensis TaxID=265981 RepID=A0ABT9GQ36_9GAMM|nr:PIN-like domain-containing protein [Alkalimonas delamerensis]MDP4529082.1 PIN-like domain-containing protein [Alkalimonas delamerensis]
MKDVFKGFYSVDDAVLKDLWKDEDTIFVFDTNVLLNLYGYAKQTRDDFFGILDAVNDKLWIPYHVGLEYQRRRLIVIKNEKVVFNEISNNLDKIQKVFKGDFERLALKRRFPKLFESTEKLEKEINRSISNYKKSVQYWDSEQPCVRSHDEIRDKLDYFFHEKVGEKPESQNWLDELYIEGKERFKNRIPPGFKDAGKSNGDDEAHFYNDGLSYESQYGDLIIWKQIIKKSQSDNVKNVIFITDDSKEDWWCKINSNGNKTIGPLAELQSEIYRESNIENFHMYSTSMFLEHGKANLSVDVSQSSIEDAEVQHLKPAAIEQLQKALISYQEPFSGNEQLHKALKSYRDAFSDNEQLQKALKSYRDAFSDNEQLQKALKSYQDKFSGNEQLQKALKSYQDPFSGNEKLQKILNSYQDSFSGRENLIKILNYYEDKNKSAESDDE